MSFEIRHLDSQCSHQKDGISFARFTVNWYRQSRRLKLFVTSSRFSRSIRTFSLKIETVMGTREEERGSDLLGLLAGK